MSVSTLGTLNRRLRGILGMAVTWAVLWAPFGAGVALWQWWAFYQRTDIRLPDKWRMAGVASLEFGLWGAVAGAGFALALIALAARSDERRIGSPRMAALLGCATGLLLTLGYRAAAGAGLLPAADVGLTFALKEGLPSAVGAVIVGFSALGATVAGAVVRLARRAPNALPGGANAPALSGERRR